MKTSRTLAAFAVLIIPLASMATAVAINPAEWNFALETSAPPETPVPPAFWSSDTNVPDDFGQYDYQWQLTEAKLQLDIGSGVWVSILDSIPAEDKSGFGTEMGLPFDILGALHIDQPGIVADISLVVDIDGYGQASMTNIVFGQLGDGEVYDVIASRFGGTMTVTAVPEPATVLLLGLGCLVLLGKRRA